MLRSNKNLARNGHVGCFCCYPRSSAKTVRQREKVALSHAIMDAISEYHEIVQEKWDEDNAPFGCDFCCGGVALPEYKSYWDMKEQDDNI